MKRHVNNQATLMIQRKRQTLHSKQVVNNSSNIDTFWSLDQKAYSNFLNGLDYGIHTKV